MSDDEDIVPDEVVGRAVKSVSFQTYRTTILGIIGLAVTVTAWVISTDQRGDEVSTNTSAIAVLRADHDEEIREVESNKASNAQLEEVRFDLSRRVDNYADRWSDLMERIRLLEIEFARLEERQRAND